MLKYTLYRISLFTIVVALLGWLPVGALKTAIVSNAYADVPTRSVVLDSQAAANKLGREIVGEYKPHRRLSNFLPGKLNVNEEQEQRLEAFFVRWHESNIIDKEAVRRWVNVIMPELPGDASWNMRVRRVVGRNYTKAYLPNYLPKVFAQYLKYLKDPRVPVKRMLVSRLDSADHNELGAALIWLRSEGFEVKVDSTTPEKIASDVESLSEKSYLEAIRMASGVKNLVPPSELEPLRKRFMDRVRYQLGLVRGMSILQFERARNRTPAEKMVEASVAVAVAGVASYTVFKSVEAKQLAGQAVNTWLPVVVSISDKLFFNYWGRAASAFFGQGITFNFQKNKFETNKLFFFMTTFLNSLIIREVMIAATNTPIDLFQWSVSFGLTWGLVAEAAGSSVRGLFSKFSLQLGVEKLRDQLNNRPWEALILMAGWNAIWAGVQVTDLYGLSTKVEVPVLGTITLDARTILGTLAILGLAHDQILNAGAWPRRIKRVLEAAGYRKVVPCSTLLVIERVD